MDECAVGGGVYALKSHISLMLFWPLLYLDLEGLVKTSFLLHALLRLQ